MIELAEFDGCIWSPILFGVIFLVGELFGVFDRDVNRGVEHAGPNIGHDLVKGVLVSLLDNEPVMDGQNHDIFVQACLDDLAGNLGVLSKQAHAVIFECDLPQKWMLIEDRVEQSVEKSIAEAQAGIALRLIAF